MELEGKHLHGNTLEEDESCKDSLHWGHWGCRWAGDMERWVLHTWPDGLRSDREWGQPSEESQHIPWMFPAFSQPGSHTIPVGKGGCWWPPLPVRDSLQGPAVAAGQPERAVRQHVGAVRDAEDEQVAARRLQQGLQPSFQATPARDRGRVRHGHPHSMATPGPP